MGIAIILLVATIVVLTNLPFGGEGTESAEQTGQYTLDETYDNVVNGMRLILKYDSQNNAFIGTVQNTLNTIIPDVRVEVHQSNGIELGPTPRSPLAPGETRSIRLDAIGTNFDKWTAHPESGQEAEHGSEGEETTNEEIETYESSSESSESHTEDSESSEAHTEEEGN